MNSSIATTILFLALSCLIATYRLMEVSWAALPLNLNSDHAILALMAQDIHEGKFPIFFYGQNYLGPLSSSIAWLFEHLFFSTKGESFFVSPQALMSASLFTLYSGLLFFALGISKLFGLKWALACFFYAHFLNYYLATFHHRVSYSEEVALFFAGILFYLYSLIQPQKKIHLFLLGLVFGVAWWMNPTVVFVVILPLGYLVGKTESYQYFKDHLFQSRRLLPVHPSKAERFLFSIVCIIFLKGVIISLLGGVDTVLLGIKLKIGNGFSSIKTALIIWLSFVFLREIRGKEFRDQFLIAMKQNKMFLLAFLIGYSPVWLGGILGWYEKSYTVSFKLVAIEHWPSYFSFLLSDFFPRIILWKTDTNSILYVFLFISILAMISLKTFVAEKKFNKQTGVLLAILLNIAFVFLADRSRTEQALRYMIVVMPLLPLVFYFALAQVDLNKYVKMVALGILLTPSLYGAATYQKNAIHNSEAIEKFSEKIQRSREIECDIIQGDFWEVYLWEYLSQRNMLAMVTQGQNRTRSRDESFIDKNLKTCTVNDF
jgi:hypothetical protein